MDENSKQIVKSSCINSLRCLEGGCKDCFMYSFCELKCKEAYKPGEIGRARKKRQGKGRRGE